MKHIITLSCCFALCFATFGQSKGSAKIYGFKEPVLAGLSPKKTIDESGGEVTGQIKSGYNYFIYLASASRVYPSEMWIDGHPYAVSIETITTPVERKNFNNPTEPKTRELIPKTTAKVIKLNPITANENKLSVKGKTLATSNELVVVYKLNGKFYYNTVSSITTLEAAAAQ